MARRGNPQITIRLDPEIMELLRERLGPTERGTAGGAALYVRRLIYQDLGIEMPRQYGEEGRVRKPAQDGRTPPRASRRNE